MFTNHKYSVKANIIEMTKIRKVWFPDFLASGWVSRKREAQGERDDAHFQI